MPISFRPAEPKYKRTIRHYDKYRCTTTGSTLLRHHYRKLRPRNHTDRLSDTAINKEIVLVNFSSDPGKINVHLLWRDLARGDQRLCMGEEGRGTAGMQEDDGLGRGDLPLGEYRRSGPPSPWRYRPDRGRSPHAARGDRSPPGRRRLLPRNRDRSDRHHSAGQHQSGGSRCPAVRWLHRRSATHAGA